MPLQLHPEVCLTGIYEILCAANGVRYIGSAVHIKKRWTAHRTELIRGVHPNQRLQRAWNKHGRSVFLWKVLEECSVDDLLEAEQRHIDSYWKVDRASLFNGRPLAHSNLGWVAGDETRHRMSAGQKKMMAERPDILAIRTATLLAHRHLGGGASVRGLKRSPETRARLRTVRQAEVQQPEVRARLKRQSDKARDLQLAKTHCKNGHEWTPENTYWHPTNQCRKCRACNREWMQRFYARKRATEVSSAA